MNLREKQIVRLLVQEAVNDPKVVLYYLESKGLTDQHSEILQIVSRVLKNSLRLHERDYIQNLRDSLTTELQNRSDDEVIVKRLFNQAIKEKADSSHSAIW
ncbi:hypothetical protein ACFJZ3_003435 [Vibrio vulnificus]|nr:hypothetical protein [Vibrio vulnificus]HDY7447338.1 hypothetical protein [Vibrio vulnificus]